MVPVCVGWAPSGGGWPRPAAWSRHGGSGGPPCSRTCSSSPARGPRPCNGTCGSRKHRALGSARCVDLCSQNKPDLQGLRRDRDRDRPRRRAAARRRRAASRLQNGMRVVTPAGIVTSHRCSQGLRAAGGSRQASAQDSARPRVPARVPRSRALRRRPRRPGGGHSQASPARSGASVSFVSPFLGAIKRKGKSNFPLQCW